MLNVQKTSRYVTSDLIASQKKHVYDSEIENLQKRLDILANNLRKDYDKKDFSFEGIYDYDSFISAVKQMVEVILIL